MILYQDFNILIELEPDESLVLVEWLRNEASEMFEFQSTFHQIIKQLEENAVRNLFINCSSAVKDMPAKSFEAMSTFLIGGITSVSSLKKVAFLEMVKPEFQAFTQKTISEFKEITGFTFLERSFKTKAEAIAWLREK